MGAPEGTVFPFAALEYDAINALALELKRQSRRSPRSSPNRSLPFPTGPGTKMWTATAGLPLVRKGEAIDYTGAGQDI